MSPQRLRRHVVVLARGTSNSEAAPDIAAFSSNRHTPVRFLSKLQSSQIASQTSTKHDPPAGQRLRPRAMLVAVDNVLLDGVGKPGCKVILRTSWCRLMTILAFWSGIRLIAVVFSLRSADQSQLAMLGRGLDKIFFLCSSMHRRSTCHSSKTR